MTDPAVLVRPEPSRPLSSYYRNLGITMVAAHARERGVDLSLADLTFEPVESVVERDPRIALFSLYMDDFANGMRVAEHIKTRTSAKTMVGGPHVSLLGEETTRRQLSTTFDYIGLGDCLPEAMSVVADIVRTGSSPAAPIIQAPTRDARMDALVPDYSIWPEDGRYFNVFPVEFSRGCRQRCAFCTDPVLRRGLAIDPVDRTMATLRKLVQEHGPIWVRFVDSSMSSLGGELDILLDKIIEERLPIQWAAYAYPHDITDELATRMAQSGCRALFLGIESLAAGVRVGKHHTKRPEEVERAVDALHANGIFVHANFIIGLPGETPETVETTLSGIRNIQFDSVGGGTFYLTPGSTFHRRAEKYGIEVLDENWTATQHLNCYNSSYSYFRTATLTQPDMYRLLAEFRGAVERRGLACWNLSDYALICWLSAGGATEDLVRLWRMPETSLTLDQRAVVSVLKEKRDVQVEFSRSAFVSVTERVARSARSVVVGSGG